MSSGPFVKNKRNFTQPLSLRDGEGTLSTALSESPVLIIIRQGPWLTLQGDTSCWPKPPVDIKTKVPFWPDLPWPGQAKVELLS